MSLTDDIKIKALQLGFDAVGITDACPIDQSHVQKFQDFLKADFAGQMQYLHRNFQKRINPAQLLPKAQSVIVVALNYKLPAPVTNPLRPKPNTGRVAHFAQYQDYHTFIKNTLRSLAKLLINYDKAAGYKICVDSAPLAERALAQRAGLGFIGKNHMLINQQLGPHILLGEIITTIKLSPDNPLQLSCRDCNRCIAVCPTKALLHDGRFDARRCISYMTQKQFEPELQKKIQNYIYGCDECALVCPYYKNAPSAKNSEFKHYPDRAYLDLQQVLSLSPQAFERRFSDSPIKEIGLDKLKQNARVSIENQNHK